MFHECNALTDQCGEIPCSNSSTSSCSSVATAVLIVVTATKHNYEDAYFWNCLFIMKQYGSVHVLKLQFTWNYSTSLCSA